MRIRRTLIVSAMILALSSPSWAQARPVDSRHHQGRAALSSFWQTLAGRLTTLFAKGTSFTISGDPDAPSDGATTSRPGDGGGPSGGSPSPAPPAS